MPTLPAVACRCGRLNCNLHNGAANRRQFDHIRRNDPNRKIYSTARWQRTRKFIIARDPLCKIADLCVQRFGVIMPSTEADHIIPMSQGGDPWDPNNLQGACQADHSKKTASEVNSNSKGI